MGCLQSIVCGQTEIYRNLEHECTQVCPTETVGPQGGLQLWGDPLNGTIWAETCTPLVRGGAAGRRPGWWLLLAVLTGWLAVGR